MKLFKFLLASLFTFTAVVTNSEVGTCVRYGRHARYEYQCVKASYDVRNGEGKFVSTGKATGTNWVEIQDQIKFDLHMRQVRIDETLAEIRETRRLKQVAKDIKGAEVSQ